MFNHKKSAINGSQQRSWNCNLSVYQWRIHTKIVNLAGTRAAVVHLISEPGQPFRSQFVLYCTDIGLIKQTINRPSRCNKVDVVRLYASYRCRFTFTKGAEVRGQRIIKKFTCRSNIEEKTVKVQGSLKIGWYSLKVLDF